MFTKTTVAMQPSPPVAFMAVAMLIQAEGDGLRQHQAQDVYEDRTVALVQLASRINAAVSQLSQLSQLSQTKQQKAAGSEQLAATAAEMSSAHAATEESPFDTHRGGQTAS